MSYVKISIIKLKRWLKYIVGSFLKVIDKLNLVLFSVLQRFQVLNFVKKKKDKKPVCIWCLVSRATLKPIIGNPCKFESMF